MRVIGLCVNVTINLFKFFFFLPEFDFTLTFVPRIIDIRRFCRNQYGLYDSAKPTKMYRTRRDGIRRNAVTDIRHNIVQSLLLLL